MLLRGHPGGIPPLDREVALLKRCLNYAVECGKLTRNPLAGVSLLHQPNARSMVVKESALAKILKAAPPAFAPVIL